MELVHIHLHLVQDQRVPGKRIVQEMTSVVVPDDMSQARMSRPCTTGTQRIALGPQHWDPDPAVNHKGHAQQHGWCVRPVLASAFTSHLILIIHVLPQHARGIGVSVGTMARHLSVKVR